MMGLLILILLYLFIRRFKKRMYEYWNIELYKARTNLESRYKSHKKNNATLHYERLVNNY